MSQQTHLDLTLAQIPDEIDRHADSVLLTESPAREMLFTNWWMTFHKNDDLVRAYACFVRKIGQQPEYVFIDGGLLWLGPV